jgi:hypothetical protein
MLEVTGAEMGAEILGVAALGGRRAWRSCSAVVVVWARARTGRNARNMPTAKRTFIWYG